MFNYEHTRDGERDHHLNRINYSEGLFWPHTESILDKYIHIKYDEFDLNEELLKRFECQEVVDYLLTLLNRDSVKSLLLRIYEGRGYHSIYVLSEHLNGLLDINMVDQRLIEMRDSQYRPMLFRSEDFYIFTESARREILGNISRIYLNNGMDSLAIMAKMFSEMVYKHYRELHEFEF